MFGFVSLPSASRPFTPSSLALPTSVHIYLLQHALAAVTCCRSMQSNPTTYVLGTYFPKGYFLIPLLYRRGLESLMRQLLILPNKPALLYFHMWMPGYNLDSYWNATIEDETEVLVHYYGLQSVSFRDAIFIHHAQGQLGYRAPDIACSKVHPTFLGHT